MHALAQYTVQCTMYHIILYNVHYTTMHFANCKTVQSILLASVTSTTHQSVYTLQYNIIVIYHTHCCAKCSALTRSPFFYVFWLHQQPTKVCALCSVAYYSNIPHTLTAVNVLCFAKVSSFCFCISFCICICIFICICICLDH